MTTNNLSLSFELSKDGDTLDIHFDEEGLSRLVSCLSKLKNKRQEHVHLMTPSWGGNELTEECQGTTSTLLNKVTIHKW